MIMSYYKKKKIKKITTAGILSSNISTNPQNPVLVIVFMERITVSNS